MYAEASDAKLTIDLYLATLYNKLLTNISYSQNNTTNEVVNEVTKVDKLKSVYDELFRNGFDSLNFVFFQGNEFFIRENSLDEISRRSTDWTEFFFW